MKRHMSESQRAILQSLTSTEQLSAEQVRDRISMSLTTVQNGLRALTKWGYAGSARDVHILVYTLTPLGQRKLAYEMAHA